MPVVDKQEASDVDAALGRAFQATRTTDTLTALQNLFVERLDFNRTVGILLLADASMPAEASRLASLDGVSVAAVQFPHADRLRATSARRLTPLGGCWPAT
jgi:ABC-type branched-subunit amino acid transport system ATPase component